MVWVDGAREMVTLRWGLVPSWSKDPAIGNRMINAKAETVAVKPAFRAAFRRRRCLIPATGFYEWQSQPTGKQPWNIQRRGGGLIAFAGLWEHWESQGESLRTCTILTTAANQTLAPIHSRMPVIVQPGHFEGWLEPAASPDVLQNWRRVPMIMWWAIRSVATSTIRLTTTNSVSSHSESSGLLLAQEVGKLFGAEGWAE